MHERRGSCLNGAVERSRGESVRVLRVEGYLHDVVRVALKHLQALPILVPVPELDEHVVRAREDQRLCGMHSDAADVIFWSRFRMESR